MGNPILIISIHVCMGKSIRTQFVNGLNLCLIETPFDAFANRADPDQAALTI